MTKFDPHLLLNPMSKRNFDPHLFAPPLTYKNLDLHLHFDNSITDYSYMAIARSNTKLVLPHYAYICDPSTVRHQSL